MQAAESIYTAEKMFNASVKAAEIIAENLCIRPELNDNGMDKLNDFIGAMRTAPLFCFDAGTADHISTVVKTLNEHAQPVMPADSMIIADPISTVLVDRVEEREEGDELATFMAHTITFGGVRAGSEGIDLYHYMAGKFRYLGNEGQTRRYESSTILCCHGSLDRRTIDTLYYIDPINHPDFVDEPMDMNELMKQDRATIAKEIRRLEVKDFINSVNTFMDQATYIDLPRHYIVEETPNHVAKGKVKTAKIPRYDDRPRWRILDPEGVKKVYRAKASAGGHHASPVPHMRIGHTKTLTAPRWKAKRWQTVHVRPSWIGDKEWDGERAKYKVIVRKGASEGQA